MRLSRTERRHTFYSVLLTALYYATKDLTAVWITAVVLAHLEPEEKSRNVA